MTYIMVDVEANGPCPGEYSMIAVGAVVVDGVHDKTFLRYIRPTSTKYVQRALDVCGFTHKETCMDPFILAPRAMKEFAEWVAEVGGKRPMFVSDNNGFDWQFVNYYFWKYYQSNPFGHSSTNLGSLYKGMRNSCFETFKHLRRTKHDHNPVNDAIGNAEAMWQMREMGLRFA